MNISSQGKEEGDVRLGMHLLLLGVLEIVLSFSFIFYIMNSIFWYMVDQDFLHYHAPPRPLHFAMPPVHSWKPRTGDPDQDGTSSWICTQRNILGSIS